MDPLLEQLIEPFTGEQLFDCLPDIVYFIKDVHGRYLIINNTLVERCGLETKEQLLGKSPSEIIGQNYGNGYEEQDRNVINTGLPLLNQLELHAYRSGEPGWCLTNKLPMQGKDESVIGLVGISQDLKMPNLSSDEYRKLLDAMKYAEEHMEFNSKVVEIAKHANMSPFQLDRCIQNVFGLTTGQWLLKTKIEIAERALVSTEQSIASIAMDVGYSDQSTFTRQFRKTTGMSPAIYRSEMTPRRS